MTGKGLGGFRAGFVLTICIGVLIAAVVMFAAREQDRLSAELSRRQLRSALAELTDTAGRIALDYGWWDEAYDRVVNHRDVLWADENLGAWLSRAAEVSLILVVEGNGNVLYSWPASADSEVSRYRTIMDAALTDGKATTVPVSGYVQDKAKVMLASGSPLRTLQAVPEKDVALVLAWDVEGHVLPRLRKMTQIPSLAVNGKAEMVETVPGGLGGLPWSLGWTPENAGQAFLYLVLPVAEGAFLVMAAFAWALWWRGSRSFERARWLEESRVRMLAAIGHDLRQPLQSISLFSAILESHVDSPRAREILAKLESSVDRMGQLLGAILKLAKLDMEEAPPAREEVSMMSVLDAIAEEMRPQAEAKGLRFRLAPSSLVIESSTPLLMTILRNLVSNAIRYTSSGSVLLGCRRRCGQVEIWVCDTGIGIPASKKNLVFEEFFQVGNPERDASKGCGLGLAIVQRLCRILGHGISFKSMTGQGSVFIVSARSWPGT